MKIIRYAAVAVLVLMSLMNIGAGTGDGQMPVSVTVIGIIVGVLGLATAVGLARRLAWATPAALAVQAINVVMGFVGLAAGWDGAPIGIAVGGIGLVLVFLATSGVRQRRSMLSEH